MQIALPWILLTVLGTAAVLVCQHRGAKAAETVFKAAASTGFVALAVSLGALGTRYGQAIVVALAFSWCGDVLLVSRNKKLFLAGLVSFLLGHFGFAAAFLMRGVAWPWSLGALVGVVPVAAVLARWIVPQVERDMRAPVVAYMAVISAMVLLAFGTFGLKGTLIIPLGASVFYVSDIFVARDRFISPGFVNALYGLPLYYGAQVLLALSSGNCCIGVE